MKTKNTSLTKFVYGVGSIGSSIAYTAFSTYLLFFYVDVMGLPSTLAGSAMVVFTIWNILNDPLAGYISDRTKTKWGRRKPYILFGSIPLAITFMLLWNPPNAFLATTSKLFAYFLTIICLYDTFFTIVELNYSAVYPEMYPELKDRSAVTAYMQGLYMIGSLIGTALPPLIYGGLGWKYMGLILGVAIFLFKMISLLGIKEEKVYSLEIQPSLWKSLSLTLKNKSFLAAVIANLLAIYATGMITAIAPFYTKYVLNFAEDKTSLFLGIMVLTSIPFLVIWSNFVVIKLGPKKSFILGKDGNAHQIGHMTIDYQGKLKCSCNKNGHWEAYCSGERIPNLIKLKLKSIDENRIKNSQLYKIIEGDFSRLDTKTFFTVAKEKDGLSLEIIDEIGRLNAIGFANVINVYDPSLITVGGKVVIMNRDLIIEPLKKHIKNHVVNRMPKITTTKLGEDICLYGAAAIVFHPDISPKPTIPIGEKIVRGLLTLIPTMITSRLLKLFLG